MTQLQLDELTEVSAEFSREFAAAPEFAGMSPAALRILGVSAALFHARGAAATSIRDITGACGLTPGSLYRHFASRDDLLHCLVAYGHDRMDQRIDAALAAAPSEPAEQLAAFVRAYVTAHLTSPRLAQLVRREYLHLSEPRYRQIVLRRRAIRERLATLLRAGRYQGAFDLIGGQDAPTRTAVMVLDLCSRTSEWFDAQRGTAPEPLAERYVQAALRIAGAA